MDLRPLDLDDLGALHALLCETETGRRLGRTPWDPPSLTRARLGTPSGLVDHRLGLWRGGHLVVAAGLEPGFRPRAAHTATLWVAGPAREAAPLLAAVVDLADRWLAVDRLELDLPAGDPLEPVLATFGFELEATRRRHRAVGGGFEDTRVLARLRPGWTVPPAQPAPSWPARGGREAAAVRVRAARPDDAAAHARIMREPSVVWGTLQVPTGGEALWRQRLEGNEPATLRALVAEAEGEVVGTAGLHLRGAPFAHVGEIGMSVAEAFQARGVGRALLEAVVALGEGWLGLSRIELEVYPDNLRAVALYEGFGFEVEGVRRRAVLRDGTYVDVQIMSRIAAGR